MGLLTSAGANAGVKLVVHNFQWEVAVAVAGEVEEGH